MMNTVDDLTSLSLPERDAFDLVQAAVSLDRARLAENRSQELVSALNGNLEMWVMIRTLVQQPESPMPPGLRSNLLRLSDYVAQTTFSNGAGISDDNLNSLININLQLAEGLLEGTKAVA